jgi:hypothetical protein
MLICSKCLSLVWRSSCSWSKDHRCKRQCRQHHRLSQTLRPRRWTWTKKHTVRSSSFRRHLTRKGPWILKPGLNQEPSATSRQLLLFRVRKVSCSFNLRQLCTNGTRPPCLPQAKRAAVGQCTCLWNSALAKDSRENEHRKLI